MKSKVERERERERETKKIERDVSPGAMFT